MIKSVRFSYLFVVGLSFFANFANADGLSYCASQLLEDYRMGVPASIADENEIVSTDFVWATREFPAFVGLASVGKNGERRGRLISSDGTGRSPAFEMKFNEQVEKIFPSVTGATTGAGWVGVLLRDGGWGVVDVINKTMATGDAESGVREVVVDPSGRYVALNIENEFFHFHDLRTGKFLWSLDFSAVMHGPGSGAFDASGEFFIIAQSQGTGTIWNVKERYEVETFKFSSGGTAYAPSVHPSPYGDRFYVASAMATRDADGLLVVESSSTVFKFARDTNFSNEVNAIRLNTFMTRAEHESPIPVAFSPAGGYFVGLANGQVNEFAPDERNFEVGSSPKTFVVDRGIGHPVAVDQLAVSQSGRKIAASYRDGSFAFWDVSDVTEHRRHRGYYRQVVTQLLFDRSETSLLVAFRERNDFLHPRPSVRYVRLEHGLDSY